MLGAWQKHPVGQVAATVNGKEVTLEGINTELQTAQVPRNADKQAVQRALHQRVIDRKLLVAASEVKGSPRPPIYIAEKLRAGELLLAQFFAKQQFTSIPVPTTAEIDKLRVGEPFVIQQLGIVTVNTITARNVIEGDPTAIRQAAAGNWHQQNFAELILAKRAALKSGAKISYQRDLRRFAKNQTRRSIVGRFPIEL